MFCYTSQLKNETDGMYSVLLKLSMKLVFWHELAHKFGKVFSCYMTWSCVSWKFSFCSTKEFVRFVYSYKVIFSDFWPIKSAWHDVLKFEHTFYLGAGIKNIILFILDAFRLICFTKSDVHCMWHRQPIMQFIFVIYNYEREG